MHFANSDDGFTPASRERSSEPLILLLGRINSHDLPENHLNRTRHKRQTTLVIALRHHQRQPKKSAIKSPKKSDIKSLDCPVYSNWDKEEEEDLYETLSAPHMHTHGLALPFTTSLLELFAPTVRKGGGLKGWRKGGSWFDGG